MEKEKWNWKEIAGYFLMLAGLYMLAKNIGYCFSDDIWYDEVFSLGFQKHSYREIMEFTAGDVHPPLYYWYLKAMVNVGQRLNPGFSEVILAKLASTIPMTGLAILGGSWVREKWGVFAAGAFLFCLFSMPQIGFYGVEIRMYSLALFLVTLAFVLAYECYESRKTGFFAGLSVFGLLTAYTQYFACVAIGMLYLILEIALWKDRAALKKWGGMVAVTVLGYLPWLPVVVRQFTTVQSGYWIPPLTWRSFFGCIKYIFLPQSGYPKLNYGLAVLLILSAVLLFFLFFRNKGSWRQWFTGEGFAVLLSFGMLGGTILIGVGVSLLVNPVFVYRYLIPCMGAFWLVFARSLSRCDKRAVWIPILLLVLCIGRMNFQGMSWEETKKIPQMLEVKEGLDKIGDRDILVFNFNQLQAVIGYYRENESYLLYSEAEPMIQELYRDYGTLAENADILKLLQEGRKVWFLGSFQAREEIVEEWRQLGLVVEEQGSYLLERYWFNLYEVAYPMEEHFKSIEDHKDIQIVEVGRLGRNEEDKNAMEGK